MTLARYFGATQGLHFNQSPRDEVGAGGTMPTNPDGWIGPHWDSETPVATKDSVDKLVISPARSSFV